MAARGRPFYRSTSAVSGISCNRTIRAGVTATTRSVFGSRQYCRRIREAHNRRETAVPADRLWLARGSWLLPPRSQAPWVHRGVRVPEARIARTQDVGPVARPHEVYGSQAPLNRVPQLPCYPQLPSYPATQLPSYPATQLPNYPATQLPSHPATQPPSYPATQLPSHPVTQLLITQRDGRIDARGAPRRDPRCGGSNEREHGDHDDESRRIGW